MANSVGKPQPPRPGLVEIVAIAISTGGPNALTEMVPLLPAHLRVPVVIVQHMPPDFTRTLAQSLDSKSCVDVCEGYDGQQLKAGTVYLAPGGNQMRVIRRGGDFCLEITDDPPENYCKPSADYLFRSIAKGFKNRSLGVIMTGMGMDGTLGLKEMKQHGVQVIAQDEKSSVVFGMPSEAIEAGVTDIIVPLSGIAAEIVRLVN